MAVKLLLKGFAEALRELPAKIEQAVQDSVTNEGRIMELRVHTDDTSEQARDYIRRVDAMAEWLEADEEQAWSFYLARRMEGLPDGDAQFALGKHLFNLKQER